MRSSQLASAQPAAVTCSTTPASYSYDRHSYCLNSYKATLTSWSPQGAVLGTGVALVSATATLSAYSGQWQESQTVTLSEATGTVLETGLGMTLTSNCTAACTATVPNPWAGSRLLKLGQSATGNVTFLSTPGAGLVSNITTKYDLKVNQPGTTPINIDATWSNPHTVRCDTTFVDNTSTGCVISDVRPKLELSQAVYGAAAATYGFAENYLIDHWGSQANPVQRLADLTTQTGNRTATCKGGASRPFVTLPDTVPGDSCDEYPFASTYQGGTNGALCADVIPQLESDGIWHIYQDLNAPAVTFNEPCARGHVPLTQNSAAGGKVGNNNQNERIIDLEKYLVVITV
ncbi:hypothetical protein OG194_00205 [Streptomyces sp. NBC_01288]|uniref:NucA/NucB deoxyribonuclease domain-containing protein n=1 Tax=Streptomyces sp. NBC_01288 TaxID=2903814 RepID=UPI002E10554F|nr:hypothetical protein OG194_00205 [Streptomyces sp. NBC_01288]